MLQVVRLSHVETFVTRNFDFAAVDSSATSNLRFRLRKPPVRGLNQEREIQTLRLTAEFNTMKAVKNIALLAGLSALLAVAASAKTSEQAYLDSCKKDSNTPVPVSVVSPANVSSDYVGSKVEVAFTVDTKGTPTGLSVVSAPDAMIARVIMDAVKQWRFTPVQHNGTAIATKVVLPVKIVEDTSIFAAN